MNETTKSRRWWGELEATVLRGQGIDIGCGPDPVMPDARPFDVGDGDANHISRHVHEQFDYVYSSHCLEHMHEPRQVLREWWGLVRPGGYLFVAVPDEDLYEQGFWPPRFNTDHKATFTIHKRRSWSPVSVNLLPELQALPGVEWFDVQLQDNGYDRGRLSAGPASLSAWDRAHRLAVHGAFSLLRRIGLFRGSPLMEANRRCRPVDQTLRDDVLAQIRCLARKSAAGGT